MNTTPTMTKGYVIESLSGREIGRIKKMILGYGNFRKTLEKVGLPESTFRDIINKGYGTPENISVIRERIFQS